MLSRTVVDYLKECGAEYTVLAHTHSESTEGTAQAAHVSPDHVAKGVVLIDESGPVLAVVPGDQWLRVHAVQELLNRTVEIAAEADLGSVLSDCELGAVPPLGPAFGIETVVDQQLFDLARVFLEGGDHEHLIAVSGEAFARLFAGARRGHIAETV